MNSILKWIVVGGLFLLPISVLLVTNSLFFPFITGKAFYYRIIVEIVFAAWILLMLGNPEYRLYKQKIYYVLFAFLGVLFISNILSEFPYKAFWSNFERMDGWIALVHHVAFFVVISSVFTTYKLWEKFWKLTLAVSVIVCFYGFLQKIGVLQSIQGGYRVDGTFGNPAYLAVYNLFNVFLAAWFLYKSRSKGLKVLYGLIGLFNLLNLFWTATRGAIVGLVVGIVVTVGIILVVEKKHTKLKVWAGGILVLVLLLLGSIFALRSSSFVVNNQILSRIASISLSSGETRFTVWSMAFEGVKEKPLLGWGQEGFSPIFAKYYRSEMYAQEPWFDRAHNIVIDWLVAGGILGLGLYLSILALGIRYISKIESFDSFEKALFIGMYSGYFVQNMFVFDNLGSYMMFFAFLAFFTVLVRNGDEVPLFGQSSVAESSVRLAQPVVAVLLVLSLYTVNIKSLRAGQEFITAYMPNQTAQGILEAFEKSLSKDTFANYEITEQMMARGADFLRNPSISNDLKEKYFSILEDSMSKENLRYGESARFNYAIGVFYNNLGQHQKAREYLTKAHELSPKKQIISFELAFAYIGTEDKELGMALLKETLDDTPEFQEARKMYALGAIYTGDRALEDELLESLPEDAVAQDPRFISAYTNAKRIDEVIRLLQDRVESNPTNIQAYVSLAAAYVEAGNRSRAIEVLQQAIEVEPGFKEQGEKFISDIQEGKL